ncbi:MAG: hypothetical protein ACI9BF_000225 [Candidatus Paceibacteria bacterium]|jgi:hypothetical protein
MGVTEHLTLTNQKQRSLRYLVLDGLVLATIPFATAQMYLAPLFLISPLIPFLFFWLYAKPYRIINLASGKFGSYTRTIFIFAVTVPMIILGEIFPYEALLVSTEQSNILYEQYGISITIYFILAPILYALTLFEFFGLLLIFFHYKKTKSLSVFSNGYRIRFGEAFLFTLNISVFIFIYMLYTLMFTNPDMTFEDKVSLNFLALMVILPLIMLYYCRLKPGGCE